MDTNNFYQPNTNMPQQPNAGGALGYDLQAEKEEIAKIEAEVKGELLAKWQKAYANAQIFPASVAAMHPEVVDFLLGFNLVGVYDEIAKHLNLDVNGRNKLPQIAWKIAQTKNWDGTEAMVGSEVTSDNAKAVLAARALEHDVIEKIKILAEKPVVAKTNVAENLPTSQQVKSVKIQASFSEALEKYAKFGEQPVTLNKIRLRIFPEPVRPSIKNWISDYRDNLGSGSTAQLIVETFCFTVKMASA